jgi:hypothetical protein
VVEVWSDLTLLPREAVALHLLLSDLAFQRGSLPEDEVELRRVVGVGDGLWHSWADIRHLWPVSGLRRGCTRARMNPLLGEAFSDASEAVSNYRKRAKKGAAGRWKKGRADGASSNASSNASSTRQAMQRRVEERKSREEKKGEGNGPPPEKQGIHEQAQKGHALEEVLEFASRKGIPESSARAFWLHFQSKGWLGIVDWRPRLEKWASEDAARARSRNLGVPPAAPAGTKYRSRKLSPEAFNE